MRNQDEESGSDEESFQPRGKSKRGANGKATKQSLEEEGPACQSCRKKKAKCSRRQPCSHCVRFSIDCVYDDKKMKPGLRTGAVENLNQRVVALENMFLGQGVLWQQVWSCLTALQSQSSVALPQNGGSASASNLRECTTRLKHTLSNLSTGQFNPADADEPLPSKRQKTADSPNTMSVPQFIPDTEDHVLPPDDLIDDLVEIYFANIHPWIPILHVRHFRERMAVPQQRRKLNTIFHAIVSLCVRFSNDPRLNSAQVRARYSKRSRQTVILKSMESFSVENLQALVICAFDTIGSGRGPSAWSIVGSMTRTVEQLQLSVEDEDQTQSAEFLIKRIAFLAPSKSWIEREERRRVFWNVFLMDRFCSIATGWNFSLTSADVKRRLPCEGALWEEGNPLKTPTPYFGVADKSSNGNLPASRPEPEDQASLGGFAFCIEASESLSLVTTFFLQHAVNVSNVHDVQMWLMRFKELDLRLVQWKIFLPEQWREACALNGDGIMDPNLTLAHITHNTAVGLLHQGIAYPSQEWQASPIRLPSVSSAETCMAAATEVAIIADRYLLDSTSLTNPQFAFCLFVSGRMLLAHAMHYSLPLASEFDSLVNSLMEISRRWNGPHAQPGSGNETGNLASKFAARLAQAREQGPQSLDIRESAFSGEQNRDPQDEAGIQSNPNPNGVMPNSMTQSQISGLGMASNLPVGESSPDSISLAFPPLPLAFQHSISAVQTAMPSPVLAHMQPPATAFYGRQEDFQGQEAFAQGGFPGSGAGMSGFEDLNSFFEYSFLPTQRISMFSGRGEEDGD